MNWFLLALISPVLYAIGNHIDKYLLEKYFKGGESGAVVLFSALFAVFALPIILIVEPEVFLLGFNSIAVLAFNGAITVVCFILYFKALRDEEASVVVPFFQIIPIFGFVLGYFLLGETLDLSQIIACFLIIVGTIILSLDFSAGKIGIKKRVAFLMTSVAFLYGISGVIFKLIAIEGGFWESLFWDFSGKVILGMLILVCVTSYRRQFFGVFKKNSLPVISLNSFNEIIFIIGEAIFAYATLLAPVALVMTVNGFQPVFVFIFGIFLTLFFPNLGKENMSKNVLTQRILAIGIITVGTYFLGASGAL